MSQESKKTNLKIKNVKLIKPFLKLGIRIAEGIKITKHYPMNESMKTKVLECLTTVDDTRSMEELQAILGQIQIEEFEYVKPVFNGIAGFAHPWTNTLSINTDEIDYSTGSFPLHTIVHEIIHKLQKNNLVYQGKEIRGLMEGATESYTMKALGENDTSYILSSNPETRMNVSRNPYDYNVLIFNQMETILGGDYMKRFALQSDKSGLRLFQELYGKEIYERIRKATNKMGNLHKYKYEEDKIADFSQLQNEILFTCYDKKFSDITTPAQAMEFLKELREIENNRIHIKGDRTFADYYTSKYQQLSERFQSEEIKKMEYTEMEFKPLYNEQQRTNLRKRAELNVALIFRPEFNDLKKYRFERDDKTIDVITISGKPVTYVYISDHNQCIITGLTPDENNQSQNGAEIYHDDFLPNQRQGVRISKSKDGRLALSVNEEVDELGRLKVEEEILQEVPIEVSRQEWKNEILQMQRDYERIENSGVKGFIKKIKSIFSRKDKKLLPEPIEETSKTQGEERRQFIDSIKIDAEEVMQQAIGEEATQPTVEKKDTERTSEEKDL